MTPACSLISIPIPSRIRSQTLRSTVFPARRTSPPTPAAPPQGFCWPNAPRASTVRSSSPSLQSRSRSITSTTMPPRTTSTRSSQICSPSAASIRITKTGSRSSTASPRPTCAASRSTRPIRRSIWTTPNTCAFSSAPVRSVSSWSRTRAMTSASPAVPAARRKRRAARCGRSVR